jgi:hypothetical protein
LTETDTSPFHHDREGLTVEELKKKIKDEAAKKLEASRPKKAVSKPVEKINKSAEKAAAAITAKAQMPYDSSAPVRLFMKDTQWIDERAKHITLLYLDIG